MLVVPQTASILVDNRSFEPMRDFVRADAEGTLLTESGTLVSLGNGRYTYSTSIGEKNTYSDGIYQRYLYDELSHSVQFANHRLSLYDWYAIFENESQVLVDDMRWSVEYWDEQGGGQWRVLDLWSPSYLPAREGTTLNFGQRYTDMESSLDVWYIVKNRDYVKMTLNLTPYVAGIYRFVWQLTGVDGSPTYLNDSILFDDVHIGWRDAELNATYEWSAASKKCDVIFDNITLAAAESYILDPSVNPQIGADGDDDYWRLYTDDTWTHFTGTTLCTMRNETISETLYYWQAGNRFQLNIPKDANIESANLTFYETYGSADTGECYRFNETNPDSLEGDSLHPVTDNITYTTYTVDGSTGWIDTPCNITDLVQKQVELSGWVSGYYMAFVIAFRDDESVSNHEFTDYQGDPDTATYLNITYNTEDEYDYVDQISNEDGSSDIGTHSSFAAQQAGPDDTFDSMTEANTGGDGQNVHDFVDQLSNLHLATPDIGTHSVFADLQDYGANYDQMQEADQAGGANEYRYVDSMAIGQWTGVGTTPYLDAQDEPTNYIWAAGNADTTGWSTFANTSGTGSGFTVNMSFYWYCDGDGYIEWDLDWTNDDVADASGSYPTQGAYGWSTTSIISGLDTADEINDCRLKLTNNKGGGGPDNSYADAGRLYIWQSVDPDYELDLEIGWTAADYDNMYEFLCIYPVTGGGWPSEDLKVDVWSGSWTNVFSDLTPDQWNNVSISSYLTGNAFEMRFLGGTEEGDSTQDTFEIDAVLLHTYNDVANYSLDLEEQWTDANYTRTNEELCIYMNTTDAEDIKVQVYNTTASDWDDLISDLTAGQWNNVSVSGWLTAAKFTIRFIDTDRTNDTNQDVWKKDCTLLHTWSGAQDLSVTVNELIGIFDSTTPSADYHLSINELIGMSESVSVGLIYFIVVLEIISLAAFVSTTLIGGVSIFETIGLAAVTTTTVNLSTTINEVINLSETVYPYMTGAYASYEILPFSDISNTTLSAGVTVLEIIPFFDSQQTSISLVQVIYEVIDLFDLVSTSGAGQYFLTINEVIPFFDSQQTSISVVQSIYEVIDLSDSILPAMSSYVTVLESLPLADTVSTILNAGVTVLEILPLADSISSVLSAAVNSFEVIPFFDSQQTSISVVQSIYEVIDLFDSVSTNVSGGGQYFLTINEVIPFFDSQQTSISVVQSIYEVIDLSDSILPAMSSYVTVLESLPLADTVSTILNAGVTVLEVIPIGETASIGMSMAVSIFEIIPFFDSVAAEINPSILLIIYEIIPIESVVVAVGGPDTSGIFYLLFLSREMWGYLGPAALVIGGYIVTKKNKILGVLWFIVICLVIGEYLNFVTASPQYWWHIYILLLGGLFTIVYPLWEDRY